mgnify:CR=1 FL=1
MARVYNFSAGPSMLPEAVLKTAQAELLDYHGSGMSVMEMSHRSKWFDEIIQNTEAAMRRELAERRKAEEARGKKAFTPPTRQREVSKALRAYGKMVSSADKGGVRIVED